MTNNHNLEIVLGFLESIEEIKEAIALNDKPLALFLLEGVERRIAIIKSAHHPRHVLHKISSSLQCFIDDLSMEVERIEVCNEYTKL